MCMGVLYSHIHRIFFFIESQSQNLLGNIIMKKVYLQSKFNSFVIILK
jgi:hypothetical protein